MVHQAGPVVDGVLQRCTRCGFVLNDYRFALGPAGAAAAPPLVGWAIGASVQVFDGDPNLSGLTDEAPDCPVGGPGARRGHL